jgi:hypothetical protein
LRRKNHDTDENGGDAAAIAVVGTLTFTGSQPAGAAAPTMHGKVLSAPTATFTKLDSPGSTAFSAADPSLLKKYGYVEQEYVVSGTACRYRIPAPLATAQLVDCGWPYKTRMLVRQPANPSKFNGKTLVEWTNTSTGSTSPGLRPTTIR